MLNLEKHISNLLYQYDCVIVPNLGGFVANCISADFNEKTGVFIPPVREIGFNRSLSHNDGLLISYISDCEGLTYEACQEKLLKHINILKYQLSRGEVLNINGIGSLRLDSVGNISFIAEKQESFNTESFGLSTFHFHTLDQEKIQNSTARTLTRKTLEIKGVKQIAASIALIFGLWMISPDVSDQSQTSNFYDMLSELKAPVVESAISDKELTKAEVVVNSNIEEEAVVVDKPEVIEEIVAPANKYFIIAASFKEKKPAELYLRNLHRKGNENAELLEGKGRYRISLEGFAVKAEATEAVNDYRKRNGYKSVWLLTK